MPQCPPTPSRQFITFEGLDGTGKSTQIEKLAKALRARGLSGPHDREPGGTATAKRSATSSSTRPTTQLSSMAEMALMFASRAQHIQEVIHPALAQGHIVLCDRFTDSTEAYQGAVASWVRTCARTPPHSVRRFATGPHAPHGLRHR